MNISKWVIIQPLAENHQLNQILSLKNKLNYLVN